MFEKFCEKCKIYIHKDSMDDFIHNRATILCEYWHFRFGTIRQYLTVSNEVLTDNKALSFMKDRLKQECWKKGGMEMFYKEYVF